MILFKHEGDSITVGGFTLPVNLFKVLEPDYTQPADLVVMYYDGKTREYRTKNKSWSIPGAWKDGERYHSRQRDFRNLVNIVNHEEIEDRNRVKTLLSTQIDLRKAEYPSIESLVVALWEKVVENRDDAANSLQAQREAIKAKYPLEEPVNVELHKRDNLNEGGTEGVRPKSKRAPRSRSKHSG